MVLRGALFVMLALAAGMASAQIYRWTDEKGRVHYGENPPAGKPPVQVVKPPTTTIHRGSGNESGTARSGATLLVPLPEPTPEEAERQRRQEELSKKAMEERDARERAALRHSPAGIYLCNELERYLRDARAGELIGTSGDRRKLSEAEQKTVIEGLIAERDKNCR